MLLQLYLVKRMASAMSESSAFQAPFCGQREKDTGEQEGEAVPAEMRWACEGLGAERITIQGSLVLTCCRLAQLFFRYPFNQLCVLACSLPSSLSKLARCVCVVSPLPSSAIPYVCGHSLSLLTMPDPDERDVYSCRYIIGNADLLC